MAALSLLQFDMTARIAELDAQQVEQLSAERAAGGRI